LQERDQADPWFCWVSFGGPHEPWDAPEPYASMYDPGAMPAPLQAEPSRSQRPRGVLDRRLRQRPALEPGDVARLRANYAGNMTLIDDQIGEILRVLEDRGQLDDTVIALVSDHGEMNGDFGLLYKQNFLNPAVRVPFLIKAPGKAAGATSTVPVELMDVGATLLELAGAEPVEGSYAQSLVPVLEDPSRPHREAALSELSGEVMLATSEWKVALNRNGRIYLLFDLVNDPHEQRNLAGRPEVERIAQDLRKLALERLIQTAV